MKQIVVLNPIDNVATSLAELAVGARFDIELDGQTKSITARDAIPFAHKVAIRSMGVGVDVVKYGEVIGRSSQAIEPGDWVHIHNVESARVESARARGGLK